MVNSRKNRYLTLLFLIGISLLQCYSVIAQPTLKQVVPDYGGNRMKLVWTSVTNAQAYATRSRVNSGSWSAWDSTGIVTSRFIAGTFNTTDTYNYQVRVKVGGTWSAASSERGAKYVMVWAGRNTANNGESVNLLHGFNQPIHAGGNTYLHEGVDINADKATADEKIVASHGGRVRSITTGTSNREVDIAILINGVEMYISYGHLKSIPATVQVGYSVMAGEEIGTIDNTIASWNTLTYHTHWHHWSNGANWQTSTLNPFISHTSNTYRDPAGNTPNTRNTNSDNTDFVLRQAKKSWKYFANHEIAYTGVDIIWEAVDRQSSDALYHIPKSVSYYIQRKSAGNWVNAVKTDASPYVLYDNIHNNIKNYWTHDKEIVDALIDPDTSYRSKSPTTPSDYVFKQWFNWIITNTKGTSGTKADFDTNQCWATNARNTVAEANGYKSNYDVARNIEEAKFPDGEYRVGIKLTDFTHTPAASYKTIKVDNFKPYVDKVTMYSGSTKFYEADWTWNTASGQLSFAPNSGSNKAACNKAVKVNIIFSEPMSSVSLNIPGLQFSQTKTTALDANKTIWEFSISTDVLARSGQSKHTLLISGQDISNSPVHGFQSTANVAAANIPKRNEDGSWTPSTASKPDKIHYFELDTLRVAIASKTDVSCNSGSDGSATVIAFTGQAPYTYKWTPSGQTGQIASGLSKGTYSVVVTDKNNCSGYADTLIEEPEKIRVNIIGGPAVIPFCIQDGPPDVTLTAHASGGTPPYSYSWPNQTRIVNSSGFYSVSVTDANGCSVDATTFVWFISILCSRDPNDITGPSGYSNKKMISNSDIAPYVVRFENDPDFATAPAQTVTVTLPFDPHLNMYSFRLAEFGFGDFDIQVPGGKTFYTTRVDVKDSLDVYVDVIAGIDATKNEAFWIFESIDPGSGLAPQDPNKGFLLVNDSVTHRGEGYVSFIVRPQTANHTGDSIKAKAKIIFDVNSAIYTNEWVNIIDAVAPTSSVNPLPPSIDSSSFLVSWSGTDDTAGSGVASYDLYVSANNQPFVLYKKDILDTSDIFTGSYGVSYKFYTRAKDNVGNKEAQKSTADAQIQIKPERFFNFPDSSASICLHSSLTITWKEKDLNYINLLYTADSGQSYHRIADGLAVSAQSYTWQIPDSLSGDTYYQIAAINAETNSLFNSSDYFIIRNLPIVDAGLDKDLCFGSSVMIGGSPTASGTASSYVYAWNNASTLSDDSISNPFANPLTNTEYIVVATDTFGCSAADTMNINLHALPVADFSIDDSSQCFYLNSFSFINTSTIAYDSFSIAWDLGDNSTALLDTVTHNYSTHGNYQVKLIATSNFTCVDSVIQTIHVNPMPVADFTINDSDQCLSGNAFSMTNLSSISSGSSNYLWQISNGDTSTQHSPLFNLANDGSYSVKLLASSDFGCQDSVTKPIIVYPMPDPSFSVNTTGQCLNTNSFAFTNNTSMSSGSASYQWFFGDNSTSVSTSPTKTYSTADTFSVKLLATSDQLCKDSFSSDVYVYPVPQLAMNINDTDQCLYQNFFSFMNNSSISSGSLTQLWTFGNDTVSTLLNPQTNYGQADSYDLKLVVTSDLNCMDSMYQKIYVRPMPVAHFGVLQSAQCLQNNSFSFLDSSTITSGSLTYLWDFDDQSNSTTQNPTHTYSSADTFEVKLFVNSDYQCSDSITKEVYTHPMPVAGFMVNDTGQCLQNNQFNFTNTSTIPSGSNSYMWDFGDNTSSTLENPTKTYASEGDFIVKLLVTSSFGCVDSITQVIHVYPMPAVAFSVNDTFQCQNTNAFNFQNTSSISNGQLTYLWNFGNGDTSTLVNPVISYTQADSLDVWLYAESEFSCSDSLSLSVVIHPGPVASFGVNDYDQCLGNNVFEFSDSSSISNGSVTYSWDFGDGDTSMQQNPQHSYFSEGVYFVTHVVESDLGCTDSLQKSISVFANPVANFTVSDTALCFANNVFTFNNLSSITQGTLNYHWTFGDGDSSMLENPVKSFTSADTFDVQLLAYTSSGCADSVSRKIYVYPNPVTSFVINDDTQCFNYNHFVFTNNSSISSGTISHSWDFGDSSTSSMTNISHIYLKADSYQVVLKSTSDLGCIDSLLKTLTIYPSPQVDFSVNDASQCLNSNIFEFYSHSSISSGSISSSWTFGDLSSASGDTVSHQYSSDTIYHVTHISTSDKQCADSVIKKIHVLEVPQIDFTINDSSQCLKNNFFSFNNLSTIDSGSLFYYWSFVSDTDTHAVNFSSLENPDHIYTKAGEYQVKLKAVSDSNCTDSLYKAVYVKANPFVHFSVYDVCLGDSSKFYDYSAIDSPATIQSWTWYFGDEDTSMEQHPVHLYDTAGMYAVSLVVGSDEGCTDSVTATTQVFSLPESGYSITYGSNGRATFLPVADSVGNSFKWYFGDGDSSESYSPTHKYAANNEYQVRLEVTNSHGCSQQALDTAIISNCLSEKEMELEKFRLSVYPNPFSTSTTIQFDLNSGARIQLIAYDMTGKEIQRLEDASMRSGSYQYQFGEKNMAAGVYFIKLFVNKKVYVERVVKVLLPY
jgi:PKD repeat protein